MSFLRGWSWPLLAAAVLAACGGIAVIDDGAGGASSQSSSGPASSSGSGASGSVSSGVGAAENCPGCSNDSFCNYPDNLCGQGQTATCSPKPANCNNVPMAPTCGCDGVVYDSECQALAQGVDLSVIEFCDTPPNAFPCGQTFCALGNQYCEVLVSDVGGEPSIYSCKTLPTQCLGPANPSCNCLLGVACGDFCDEPLPFRFRVTCPGG